MSSTSPQSTSTQGTPQALNQSIGYFATFIGLGMTAASLGPTLPGLAENTNSNIAQISFLFTARSFGYLLGSLRGGRAFDRLKGQPLMAGLLFCMAGMMALVPFAKLLWLLTALLFILGTAEGAVDVGGNTLLVWVHRERVGPYMNALHFFFGIGALLAPLIAAQFLLRTNDIAWVYWLLALYLLPVTIYLMRQPSPSAPSSSHSGQEALSNPTLIRLIVLFFILYVGAEASFGGWIFTYATELNLANPVIAAYLTSIFWGFFTLGRLVGIPLSTRFSPHKMLTWDLVGSLASILLILFLPGSIATLALGVAGLGFSFATIFPGMLIYAGKRMPITGKVNGYFLLGAGMGAMIFPVLIGQFFGKFGPAAVMWIVFLDLVALAITYSVIVLFQRRSWARRQSSAV